VNVEGMVPKQVFKSPPVESQTLGTLPHILAKQHQSSDLPPPEDSQSQWPDIAPLSSPVVDSLREKVKRDLSL